jgi:transcriptional regulator with XRE-family HTH domain
MTTNAIPNRPPAVQAARNTLRRKGWSHKEAAERLSVSTYHLSLVLNGHRQSRRILNAIQEFPENPTPA